MAMIKTQRVHLLLPLAAQPSASDQIRPLADIVHFKYSHTYLLTYLLCRVADNSMWSHTAGDAP